MTAISLLLASTASACGVTADGGLHHYAVAVLIAMPFLGAWLRRTITRAVNKENNHD